MLTLYPDLVNDSDVSLSKITQCVRSVRVRTSVYHPPHTTHPQSRKEWHTRLLTHEPVCRVVSLFISSSVFCLRGICDCVIKEESPWSFENSFNCFYVRKNTTLRMVLGFLSHLLWSHTKSILLKFSSILYKRRFIEQVTPTMPKLLFSAPPSVSSLPNSRVVSVTSGSYRGKQTS